MKKLFLLPIVALLLHSCSEQKKIARFVKKNGPKQIAAYIAREYPEYLKADTIRYIDTVIQKVEVRVPEVYHDTIILNDTINDCKEFRYADKNLQFNVKQSKVNYRIFERIVKDTVTVYIDKEIPCPPCPTETIVQEVKRQTEIEKAKNEGKLSFYLKGFWSLLTILLLIIGYKVLKFMGKL